jgi:hypothetical protein
MIIALILLIVNFFLIGTLVDQLCPDNTDNITNCRDTMHTSILVSVIISGIMIVACCVRFTYLIHSNVFLRVVVCSALILTNKPSTMIITITIITISTNNLTLKEVTNKSLTITLRSK